MSSAWPAIASQAQPLTRNNNNMIVWTTQRGMVKRLRKIFWWAAMAFADVEFAVLRWD
jgi:hypothetical protein